MKILITGKNSAIGNKIQSWIESKNRDIVIEQLDVIGDEWKMFDYSSYDTIIHVAAIVHKPNCTDWSLYERVNVELPFEIAKRAKKQGVKQFLFFSTMAVYGIGKVLDSNLITSETIPCPNDMYGRSKLMAEEKLLDLKDGHFLISIVRPPNVYGPNGRGGYLETFVKVLKILPVIPNAYKHVTQSMIHLDNLTEFIYQIVTMRKEGVFMPQDDRAISTVELLELICKAKGWRKPKSSLAGLFIRLLKFIPLVEKAYGGVAYEIHMSNYNDINYRVVKIEAGLLETFKALKA